MKYKNNNDYKNGFEYQKRIIKKQKNISIEPYEIGVSMDFFGYDDDIIVKPKKELKREEREKKLKRIFNDNPRKI